MLAVKNYCGCAIRFEPIKREEITLNLRYIAGTLKFGDMQPLNIFYTCPINDRSKHCQNGKQG
jgi:hypothetical protein